MAGSWGERERGGGERGDVRVDSLRVDQLSEYDHSFVGIGSTRNQQ